MALSTRAIRSKIKSVSNIRKITKAMELVSASKMRRATENTLATREYSEEALQLLVHISGERHVEHRLLSKGRGDKSLFIVITSNKGLCGGFNVNVIKSLNTYLKNHAGDDVDFITVGKYAERAARRLKRPVIGSFVEFSDDLGVDEIRGLAKLAIDEFVEGNYKRVFVLYTHYESAIQYKPVIRELLPIQKDIIRNMIDDLSPNDDSTFTKRDLALYLFEPDEEEVLNLVLPRLFESVLYQSLLESLASEHSARMFAMKSATDNATDVLDELTLSYNHARQSAVTQEISEIAAAANALTT